jgi:hypothetical protein
MGEDEISKTIEAQFNPSLSLGKKTNSALVKTSTGPVIDMFTQEEY